MLVPLIYDDLLVVFTRSCILNVFLKSQHRLLNSNVAGFLDPFDYLAKMQFLFLYDFLT